MNWNEAIHYLFPPKNQVEIAGDKLQCFVDAVKRIDERAKYNSMGQRKLVPGFRFFQCIDCGEEWKEKSRDCLSPSNDTCPSCMADTFPHDNEEHPEWRVDKSGNLI